MNIIADENIPQVQSAFADFGEITTLPGRNLQHSDLLDCDILLVRSVTQVNETLIRDTPIKFVASATIGTDHVDLDYLQQNNIGFANAPGCNAEAAAEYIINALFELSKRRDFNPFELTAGIIGHGNVGSRVRKKLDALGIPVLVNDPPLQDAGDDSVHYVSLQSIIDECDFITLHVPLTREGPYPTYHLFDETRLSQLHKSTILFNAARGAVIDNQALSSLLEQRQNLTVFLDTWENEPEINLKLLQQVDLATPHIAGYSVEGKLRGTQMILDATCQYFHIHKEWMMQDHLPPTQTIFTKAIDQNLFWFDLLSQQYRVFDDHQHMLELAHLNRQDRAAAFDLLRKDYPKRYEYNHYQVSGIKDKKIASQVERLLFSLKD